MPFLFRTYYGQSQFADQNLLLPNSGGTILTPSSITSANLLAWFDAADTTTITAVTSNNVTQWNDKSGKNYNLVTNGTANAPKSGLTQINGLNIIDTTNSSSLSNTSFPFPTTYTIYAVGFTTTTGYRRLVHAGVGIQDSICLFGANGANNTNNFEISIGNGNWTGLSSFSTNIPINSTVSTKQLYLFGGTNNGTALSLCGWVNGSSVGVKQNNNVATTTGLSMGAYYTNGTGDPWLGYVGEIIMYNSVLTEVNRRKIEGYLAWKWGIQTSLPSSHQFYSTSPKTTSIGYSVTIPSGVTGGAPTLYYPFWSNDLNYATGNGVSNITYKTNSGSPITYSTNAFYADSGINGSLYCANFTSSVWLPNISINTSSGYTILLWFYATNTNNNGMLWRADNLFIFWTSGNVLQFRTFTDQYNIYNVSRNVWYHITFVQPSGNGQPYVLLNNTNKTNVGTATTTGSITTTSYNTLFSDVATYPSWQTGGMSGYMNNFYFFNRPLSASEITAIYNQ